MEAAVLPSRGGLHASFTGCTDVFQSVGAMAPCRCPYIGHMRSTNYISDIRQCSSAPGCGGRPTAGLAFRDASSIPCARGVATASSLCTSAPHVPARTLGALEALKHGDWSTAFHRNGRCDAHAREAGCRVIAVAPRHFGRSKRLARWSFGRSSVKRISPSSAVIPLHYRRPPHYELSLPKSTCHAAVGLAGRQFRARIGTRLPCVPFYILWRCICRACRSGLGRPRSAERRQPTLGKRYCRVDHDAAHGHDLTPPQQRRPILVHRHRRYSYLATPLAAICTDPVRTSSLRMLQLFHPIAFPDAVQCGLRVTASAKQMRFSAGPLS